ncbi:nucleoside diphosphate kinase [Terrimicrobium sacchariphilum]|jgi:nucleoside diphosphate kinase|uniref:nucleoside-diphosphate kinase n=1 Tax=Terrimicrobium sacchariphilum TaxID=690879 RepID=A0A146GCS1_TERSA|nr:nucleoside-diphosphate kinase [Terrimicrobium sacchariphilum]GAT35379.1 nucleoside diphosphate kinase [Terrimicrobium sacchariphilum]
MADELSYVLITPYSLRKSRTGGIVGRLLSRSGLELVSGRLFAPSEEFIQDFAEASVSETDNARHRQTQELIRDYILKNLAADQHGVRQRALLLVLRGEDAVIKTRSVVGHIMQERTSGETIRDTYGDCLVEDGKVVYFEPGVLAAPDATSARRHLEIFAKYSDTDGGILVDSVPFPAGENVETTLVLIKPDNFRFPNARPGGVIDLFSRTGLYIVGFKVHYMSVAQAEKFYGPVLDVLQDKFREPSAKRARLAIEEEFGIPIDAKTETELGELIGPIAGRSHWESIVQFMAGSRPSNCTEEKRNQPGSEKCVALIYQGVDAVRKIREVLGPTDPSKAPSGTIRREFGQTVMINAAHASDSAENARREMDIIQINENTLKPLIDTYLS